jgi:ATP-binding cassette subfamily B protein
MIKRFFTYYLPHKKLFILDFGSAVIVALLELAFPLAVAWFINTLIPGGDWQAILWVAAGLLSLYMLSTYLQYVVNYWGHVLVIKIETDMRQELFEHVHKQSFRFF